MSDSNDIFSGLIDPKPSVQIVRAGLNFRIWSTYKQRLAEPSAQIGEAAMQTD